VVKLKKFTQIDYNYWSNFILQNFFWSYFFKNFNFFFWIIL